MPKWKYDVNNLMKKFFLVNERFKGLVKRDGIKFHENLMYFARTVYNRPRRNADVYLALTGWEGTGKSNLANLIGFLVDPNFSLERNVIYSPNIKEIKRKIEYRKIIAKGLTPSPEALPPYSFINVDEAIKVIYKLEQWSGVQRFLKKLFALARVENKIIALCIPDFLDMGNNFRKRMNYWMDVYHRNEDYAYTTVDIQSKNKYRGDRWNMRDNEKIYEDGVGRRKYADITPDDHLKICRRTKNYLTSFNIPRLPRELEDEYNRLKMLHDYDEAELEVSGTKNKRFTETHERLKKMVAWLRELHPEITHKEIAERVRVSRRTVGDWLRVEGDESNTS